MAEGLREVHIVDGDSDAELTGTLPLGAHPDGELTFEDGTAIVSTEVAGLIAGRYPNLEVGDSPIEASEPIGNAALPGDAAELDEDAGDDEAYSDSGPVADPPLDPGTYTVDELKEELEAGEFSAPALDAIEQAERAGDGRTTALDVIDSAREE